MGTPREILKTREPGTAATELARVFTDDADHEVVQRRLGLLYGVLGATILGFYVVGAVTMLVAMPAHFWALHLSAPKTLHLLVGLALVLVWLICRRPKLLPRWMLSTFDLVGTAKLMAVTGTMIAFAPGGLHLEFLILPPLVLVTCLRAALVPSPPRWTTLVAAATAAPVPIAAYISTLNDPSWNAVSPLAGRSVVVVVCAVWGVVAVGAAFVISKIVYGLRVEVKHATRLGQYTLEEKIGEGGMGVVYRARHSLLRRPTAIKLLLPERSSVHDVRRFEREVQLTSMLTHPNTVAVYDFGHTHEGVFYYAMEHLDGISLHDLVERDGPQPSGRVIHILSQIASALGEAHAVHLVHRDVKPANIFLCERGGIPDFVKVLDFGLVKNAGQSDLAMSTTNAITGTPHYMAPESITDPASVDARVDIYALGAVGYFLLTGTTTFEGNSLVEICSHHLHTAPEPPHERLGAAVSPSLEKVILQCLAKSRSDRPKTADDLIDLLRACQSECEWSEAAAREWWRTERTRKSAPTSKAS